MKTDHKILCLDCRNWPFF